LTTALKGLFQSERRFVGALMSFLAFPKVRFVLSVSSGQIAAQTDMVKHFSWAIEWAVGYGNIQRVMKIALMFFAPTTLLGLLDLLVLAAFSPLVIALMAARLIVSTRKALTGSRDVRS